MSLLSSKRNQFIAAFILVLVLVMVYMNFVSPVREESVTKSKLLVQKQKELEALNKRVDGAGALGAEEQVNLSKARSRVPEVPDIEGLIRDVRMLEVITKMPLASYNFEIGKEGAKTAQPQPQPSAASASGSASATNAQAQSLAQTLAIPIMLNTTAKGDYQQIYRFLDELQSSQRLMQVEKLTFAVKSAPPVKLNAAKREITVNVSLVSYYAPGMQKFFKAPLPVPYSQPGGKTNPVY